MSDILYKKDFYLWLEAQRRAISERNIEAMDWDNMLEEIEDMGASQKRALRSYYKKLVEHILKLRDWHAERERNERGWRVEVTNFRSSIKEILEESPSLKNYLAQNNEKWFATVTNNLAKNRLFVVENNTPIPLEEIMNDDYFGNSL